MLFWRKGPQSAPRGRGGSILVIKLGAIGDFIQALAAARIIRAHHIGARITLLTTEPFKAFAEKCPYFDVVDADGRPREATAVAALIARIRAAKHDFVYDLQTSGRTSNYFHALKPRPPLWSGVAPGCSHPHANPKREEMHTLDRLAEQLEMAGVPRQEIYADGAAPMPDLGWVRRALGDPPRLQPGYFGIKGPYVLLIPGASPHRPEKRWPAKSYAEMAQKIAARGVTPVVIGALAEKDVGAAVAAAEPRAKNLVTRTDLFQVAALAERAQFAVGNDTGPMHMAAAAGQRCLVLFSANSDPERVQPRSRRGVAVLTAANLEDLPVRDVEQAMRNMGAFGWPVPA
ncbi:MAG: glycosyltransferase family 9 protein [Alphaproteobacteria bacterium]|jgi:ADP-heptose:LPS heptosyltransferase|nr:glycosyltransferase family 9 protein [Alphaproteobacteria bacterium]